jgi:hypothetical protein
MRKSLEGLAVLMIIGLPLAAAAQDGVPNLVGRWTIHAEGMAIRAEGNGPAEPVAVDSVFVIDKQDGFRISGKETSQRPADGPELFSHEEHFAGVISADNKTVSMVDENGFRDCDIISPDRMECIYRHVASPNAVVTRNLWTRQSN